MIIRAIHTAGYLDVSSQELLQGELTVFRLAMLPGQEVEIPNEYRVFRNINTAINAGLLEVVSYKSTSDSIVVHDQINTDVAAGGVSIGAGGIGVVDSVPLTTGVTNKWFVSVDDGANVTTFSCEVLAHYDGSAVSYTTYSKLGVCSVTLSVDVSGGNMRLLATATANDQTVKSERITVVGA